MTTAVSLGIDDAHLSVPAVDRMADLRETEAIETLLGALARLDCASDVHARIVTRLPDFGAAVIEPLLAALSTSDLEQRDLYCSILARVSTRDERIFEAIGEAFFRDAAFGAQLYVDYGDPRALPVLEKAIASFDAFNADPLDELRHDALTHALRALGGGAEKPVQPRVSSSAPRHQRRLRRRSA